MDNDLTDLNIKWIKSLQSETVLAELWDWAKRMSTLPFEEQKSASLICHLKKDVQGIVYAPRTNFSELHIKEYHDFGNVDKAWKDVDLVAYTSTLKIGVSCTDLNVKDYIYYIEQRSLNVPITEEVLFNWLLKAKRECLPQELQNRKIFPNTEFIIRNKDIPTVQLWAGMVVSIIEVASKSEKDSEISKIANANILNYEMVDYLENKPKKTLEEMHALSRFHIANCYGISPESLIEEFITDYDAGTNNETAVEAIIREYYRNDRLTTITQAEKH
ncbi:4664_t:CDS:2 [Gigaspora rosea]|nr:4664_t:CDS:2 [Gigaspora rosea]